MSVGEQKTESEALTANRPHYWNNPSSIASRPPSD